MEEGHMEEGHMEADHMEEGHVAEDDTRAGPAKRHGKALLATIGATTAVALAAGGVAAATSGGSARPSAATVAPSASGKHPLGAHPRLERLVRRTVHAQFVLRTKDGGFETFDYDRGVLRSSTSTGIVIAPADAPSTTVSATITSKTRFRGLPESQLEAGDQVALLYQGSDAVVVVARAPKSTASPKG